MADWGDDAVAPAPKTGWGDDAAVGDQATPQVTAPLASKFGDGQSGPIPGVTSMSGAENDKLFTDQGSYLTHVANAIGQGFMTGFGSDAVGFSDEHKKWLADHGISHQSMEEQAKGSLLDFNNMFVRPAVSATYGLVDAAARVADTIGRTPGAIGGAIGGGIARASGQDATRAEGAAQDFSLAVNLGLLVAGGPEATGPQALTSNLRAAARASGEGAAPVAAGEVEGAAPAAAPVDLRQALQQANENVPGRQIANAQGITSATEAETGPLSSLPYVSSQTVDTSLRIAAIKQRQQDLTEFLGNLDVHPQAQEATETLSRVQQVESDLTNPDLSAGERKALSDRRDELLTNTNPETLQGQAIGLNFKTQAEAEQRNLQGQLDDITKQAQAQAEGNALSPLPKLMPENDPRPVLANVAPDATAGAEVPISERIETGEPSQPIPPKVGSDAAAIPIQATRADRVTLSVNPEATTASVIDRAGNIRLDNAPWSDGAKAVILKTAEEAGGDKAFWENRRGVQSLAQRAALADAAGMDPELLNGRKIGQAFNDWQVEVATRIFEKSSQDTAAAMQKAALDTASEQDELDFIEKFEQHKALQEQFSGVTAEGGRTLNALRKAKQQLAQYADLTDMVKQSTGKGRDYYKKLAQAGRALQTPQQVSKFIFDSRKPTFGNMFQEYFIHDYISGPITHTAYFAANNLQALWHGIPETLGAAAIDMTKAAGRRALGMSPEQERVYFGEVGANIYGYGQGFGKGVIGALRALRDNVPGTLPGEDPYATKEQMALLEKAAASGDKTKLYGVKPLPPQYIPGVAGTVLRAPSRLVYAIHTLSRSVGYYMDINKQAYREAVKGGTGQFDIPTLSTKMAKFADSPPPEAMLAARAQADEMSLMTKPEWGSFQQKLESVANHNTLTKFVVPFARVAANITDQAFIQRQPLGVLSQEVRDNILGRNGGAAQSEQLAKISLGVGLGIYTMSKVNQGVITGGGPSEPNERATWLASGKQPYSIDIGGHWWSYARMGILAMQVKAYADMAEHWNYATDDEKTHPIMLLASSAVPVIKDTVDENWARGFADLLGAIEDPQREGPRYIRNQVAGLSPFSVGMGQIERNLDPNAHRAQGIIDTWKTRTPGAQTLLGAVPIRRDIFGEPLPSSSNFDRGAVQNNPAGQELMRLHIYPAPMPDKIMGVKLTPDQYDDYTRIGGRLAKQNIDNWMANPSWSQIPDFIQQEQLRKAITAGRDAAQAYMKIPDDGQIIRDSVKQRVNQITGQGAPQ